VDLDVPIRDTCRRFPKTLGDRCTQLADISPAFDTTIGWPRRNYTTTHYATVLFESRVVAG